MAKNESVAKKDACPRCGRVVPVEDGWIAKHREDPPSTSICRGSGTYLPHEAAAIRRAGYLAGHARGYALGVEDQRKNQELLARRGKKTRE